MREPTPQWIRQQLSHRTLSEQEEFLLFEKGTEEAHLEIHKHYKRACMKAARQFDKYSLSIEDRYRIAEIELWKTIKKHDHTKISKIPDKFGNQKRVRLIDHFKGQAKFALDVECIRAQTEYEIPKSDVPYVKEIRRIAAEYERLMGYLPSNDDLKTRVRFQDIVKSSRIKEDTLLKWYRLAEPSTSLNEKVEFGEKEIIDLIEDESANVLTDEVDEFDIIEYYLKPCNEKEKEVFRQLYIVGHKQMTVAHRMKVNDRTIRKYSNRAVEKIRYHILTDRWLYERVKRKGYIDKNIHFLG